MEEGKGGNGEEKVKEREGAEKMITVVCGRY